MKSDYAITVISLVVIVALAVFLYLGVQLGWWPGF